MFDFIDTKTLLLIIHVFGVIIGAGAAYIGDAIFFRSVRDGMISKTEYGFMNMSSRFVWIGLAIMLLSGIGIFFLNIEGYLASSKFLAKMTIVLILAINGYIFHVRHIPHLHKSIDAPLHKSESFKQIEQHLVISGAISVVSWTFAVIFGMLSSIPYSYWTIMGVYAIVVVLGILIARQVTKRIF